MATIVDTDGQFIYINDNKGKLTKQPIASSDSAAALAQAAAAIATANTANAEAVTALNSASAPPVPTVFGRTGSIIPQTGDYDFSQLTGSVHQSQLSNPTPEWINVTTFGAVGDMRSAADGHTFLGSPTLSSNTIKFAPADIGKPIIVSYAGGTVLFNAGTIIAPTIVAVAADGKSCTVSANAGDNTNSGIIQIGTDNSTAFSEAFAALFALPTGVLYIPAGSYLCLAPWGTLTGLGALNQYAIIGSSPLVNNGITNAAATTNIILSPYITYNNSGATPRFLSLNYQGVIQDICFTNFGVKNSAPLFLGSNIILYYIQNVVGASIRCSWDCTLPIGANNGCLQIASDNWRSYSEQITSTCGGLTVHGQLTPMVFALINAVEYGISAGDIEGCYFQRCKITATGGSAVVLDGTSGGARNNHFEDCILWGSGIGNSSAVTALNAGTAPYNVFSSCKINADHVTVTNITSNLTAVKNAVGNILIFIGCSFGAFGTGNAFDNAGKIVCSTCFFPTQQAWQANITYEGGVYPAVIIDSNGNLQYVSSVTGIAGSSTPSWATKAGTTLDGALTWTFVGVAATIEHNTGAGSIIDGGGNLGL